MSGSCSEPGRRPTGKVHRIGLFPRSYNKLSWTPCPSVAPALWPPGPSWPGPSVDALRRSSVLPSGAAIRRGPPSLSPLTMAPARAHPNSSKSSPATKSPPLFFGSFRDRLPNPRALKRWRLGASSPRNAGASGRAAFLGRQRRHKPSTIGVEDTSSATPVRCRY
jgi:hypothetical protein